MTLDDLRKFVEQVEDMPGDTEIICESGSGQKDMLGAEVCTHENDGMHYSTETMETSIREGDGLDPECWDELKKPTIKFIDMH